MRRIGRVAILRSVLQFFLSIGNYLKPARSANSDSGTRLRAAGVRVDVRTDGGPRIDSHQCLSRILGAPSADTTEVRSGGRSKKVCQRGYSNVLVSKPYTAVAKLSQKLVLLTSKAALIDVIV